MNKVDENILHMPFSRYYTEFSWVCTHENSGVLVTANNSFPIYLLPVLVTSSSALGIVNLLNFNQSSRFIVSHYGFNSRFSMD